MVTVGSLHLDTYQQDGLSSIHNHEFMHDPRFIAAYARGVSAVGQDYHWYWRMHIGLWAAQTAARLPGDFVECGVNRGFLSSIMALLDTFRGVDPRVLSDQISRIRSSQWTRWPPPAA